jgi:hypothetical protein
MNYLKSPLSILLTSCAAMLAAGLASQSASFAAEPDRPVVRAAGTPSPIKLVAAQTDRKVECPPAYVAKPLAEVAITLAPKEGDMPPDCAIDQFPASDRRFGAQQRPWPATMLNWEAVAICHKPLYFEDVALERYGQTHCHLLQPLISGAQFYATFPLLPYKMALDPPHQCDYNLGYYRPGSPAPCV